MWQPRRPDWVKNVREMRSPHWQHLLHWLSASHWTRLSQFYSQKTHLHVNLHHQQYCCQPEKRVSPHPLQPPSLEVVFQAPKNHGSDFRWLSCIWLSLYPKCRDKILQSDQEVIYTCMWYPHAVIKCTREAKHQDGGPLVRKILGRGCGFHYRRL